MRSKESRERSKEGAGVGAEEATDFFENGGEMSGVAVAEIAGEDQIVAAFFEGALGDVHETGFIGAPTAAETFGDIRGD